MTLLCEMSRCCDPVCGRGRRGWFNTSQFCNTLKTIIRTHEYVLRTSISHGKCWRMRKKNSVENKIKDKTSTHQKHYNKYIIYGCRLNNLETKSTHTQSPYPSKIIMISAMKNSNWIADFIYTSSAQVQVGQWPIERGHTHRKPPPFQNKNKTIKPFIIITSRLKY